MLAAAAVAGLSETPRVMAAAGALPDALRPFVWSDLLATYVTRGLDGGRLPYFDVFFEYPPVIGYIAGLFSALTRSATAYTVAWAVVVVASSAGIAYLLAREAGWGATLRGWVLAPQVLLLSGLNADLLPAALLLAGAVLARHRRPVAAGIALAFGTAAKLFPAVGAPLLLFGDRRRGPWAIGAFAAMLLALAVPAIAAPQSALGGIVYYAAGYQAGGVAVWGLVAATLGTLGVPEPATLVLVATTIGLAATYVLLVLPKARTSSDPAVGFALGALSVLLWARLYSPQFSLWIVPFGALLGIERTRSFWLLALADTAVFFTASPLTLVRWESADGLPTLLLGTLAVAVVLRHVALIGLWRAIVRGAKQPRAR